MDHVQRRGGAGLLATVRRAVALSCVLQWTSPPGLKDVKPGSRIIMIGSSVGGVS